MNRHDLYIIERRAPNGKLTVLTSPQPHDNAYFGPKAITGLTTDEMAKAIFRRKPDAVLTGDSIAYWPRELHPEFVARHRYW